MFRRYKIAGLVTEIDYSSAILEKQAVSYAYDGNAPADLRIKVPDYVMRSQLKKNPHLSYDELEYIFTGYDFCRQVLRYGAFVLHSSAVVYDGYAYLFSADCGTGKSTHASFWQKNFGSDKALVINDDKPLIFKKDGVFCASGTPWSGKSDKNLNMCAPIAGIAILKRSPENHIKSIKPIEAFKFLYSQTYRPGEANQTDLLLNIFNGLLAQVGLFELGCNMSCEAAQTAYEAMCPAKS